MTDPETEPAGHDVRLGIFRYPRPAVELSLYRNGSVLTRRDRDGSDSGGVGVGPEDREMAVLDAREPAPSERPTRHANGSELVARQTGTARAARPPGRPDLPPGSARAAARTSRRPLHHG